MLGVQVWSQSFGVKIRGSKPEKLGFHLASCNMQLLANYTKYYTAAIFTLKLLNRDFPLDRLRSIRPLNWFACVSP